ncbi:F1 capsule-anchoring protein [Achromobacter kerstersii]|uniref:F1 capsule-anchoring protein n=2 Tax=Achromobacter kerstersii TaxID=1353890 RepID=A0A6S7AQD0_9BURK|nr:F1 capsule-anchoring protein [Achromobacter kerstersii]
MSVERPLRSSRVNATFLKASSMKTFNRAARKGDQPQCASARSERASMLSPMAYTLVSVLLLAPVTMACAGNVVAQADASASFDHEMLRHRGIDPKLAEYLRDAPRFSPGARVVELVVNGVSAGKIDAHFDQEGSLCFDENLIKKARLRVPSSSFLVQHNDGKNSCYDFVAAFPQTSLTLRPNREQIYLVVSQDAMRGDALEAQNFTEGGIAALANYDIMTMRSKFGDTRRDSTYATTQVGFNIDDWIVRSRQLFSKDGDQQRFNHLYAYAQRTFPDQRTVVQGGQININSPVFAGAPITGFQFMPESALSNTATSGALVQGIAQSQATVEVRQAGVLIYSTMVPEGQFALTDIPLLNTSTDLDVTVQESGGQSRSFLVPAATFRNAMVSQPGYSFAVGKVRELSSDRREVPVIAAATSTWKLNDRAVLSVGTLGASSYQTIGSGVDASLHRDVSASLRGAGSNASRERVKGAQIIASANARATERLSVGVSAKQQTSGYRDLADTLVNQDSPWRASLYKGQYTASVNWSHETLGSFNAAYSKSQNFEGNADNRLIGSWGKTMKYATVTANVETNMGSASKRDSGRSYSNDNAVYLNVSIPLGSRNVRTYVSKRGSTIRTGAAMSDVVNDQLNYRVSVERNSLMNQTYASGNFSVVPRYASADFGYSQGGSGSTQSGRISGGIVAHKNGITLSPYAVQDTFGLVTVGDLSGVKLTTPNGPVWTDAAGQAVVPQLNAYRTNRVEVQPKSLPRRVDLRNGFQSLQAGRGSVNHLHFDVIKARRVMVDAVDGQGKALPKGSSVLDSQNNFLTTVLDKGTIFLTDANPDQTLKVSLPGDKACTLDIHYPKENNDDIFYESAPAVCH